MRCRRQNLFVLLGLLVILLITLFLLNDGSDPSPNIHTFKDRELLQHVTRDPKRKVVYNYPISNNYTLQKIKIDVSEGMYSDQVELDRHMPVVTGFKQNEAYLGLGMVASVQSHMPLKKIIVYTLGVHPKIVKQMRSMCNVEVRTFDFNKYPRLVSKPENRAWRVHILMEVLQEFGAFFYASPQVRFRSPVNLLLPFIKDHKGIIGKLTPDVTVLDTTHPDTFKSLNIDIKEFEKDFPKATAISEHVLVVMNNSQLYDTFWKPLRACAEEWKCIAPKGSTPDLVNVTQGDHTHHYDMSVVNIFMYKYLGTKWTDDPALAKMMKRVVDFAKSGGLHDYLWAHYCNPPKMEIDCTLYKSKC